MFCKGIETIARVLSFIASQCDGAARMAGFHRIVGESGPIGRRLLLRLYSIVKCQSPNGPQASQNYKITLPFLFQRLVEIIRPGLFH